ncbi:hypothetical protein ACWDTI_19490 [Gordonia sp. NPDC003424]
MKHLPIGAEHLLFRSDAIKQGVTDEALRADVRDRRKIRVWRGAYLASDTSVPGVVASRYRQELERHHAMVVAASRNGGPGRIVSHTSAAVLHGIPMLRPDLSIVHFTAATTGKRSAHGITHQATLKDSEILFLDGLPATSPARTVCDAARLGSVEQAVCVLDSGLHLGVTRDEIDEQARRLRRHHGAPTLRAALALADGRAESVGETVSRLVLADNPLIPEPELQVPIWIDLDGGKHVYGDFGWRDESGTLRLIGEFDGRVKYHRSNPFSDQLPEDVVFAEKLREDAIRATGPNVVRWIWADSMRPRILHAKVLSALQLVSLLP